MCKYVGCAKLRCSDGFDGIRGSLLCSGGFAAKAALGVFVSTAILCTTPCTSLLESCWQLLSATFSFLALFKNRAAASCERMKVNDKSVVGGCFGCRSFRFCTLG